MALVPAAGCRQPAKASAETAASAAPHEWTFPNTAGDLLLRLQKIAALAAPGGRYGSRESPGSPSTGFPSVLTSTPTAPSGSGGRLARSTPSATQYTSGTG